MPPQTVHKNAMTGSNANMPWSLVGVSDEARQHIRAAAAQSDQTIGQWLNDRILQASRGAPESGGYTGHTPGPTPSPTRVILERMERILDDSEAFSAREIAAFVAILDAMAIRVDDLETRARRAGGTGGLTG